MNKILVQSVLLFASTLAICGCSGGGGDDDSPKTVVSLNDEEVRSLCVDFISTLCDGSSDSCDDLGISDIPACCAQAEIPASFKKECIDPITDEDVKDCAIASATNDPTVAESCIQRKGGCAFDATEKLC